MRKVVSHLFISLDGVVENPEWTFQYFDEGCMEELDTQLKLQDTVLLGRVSYQEWADYWPTATDEPFASFINNAPKHVVSTTLKQVTWQNSRLLTGDLTEQVNKLKQQPGKNIAVAASPTLVQSMLQLGLIDELRLTMFPVVVGSGRRLFEAGGELKHMKLVESNTTGSGVVILAYQPEKA